MFVMWPRFRAMYGLDLRVSIQKKKVSKVCLKSNRIWKEEGQIEHSVEITEIDSHIFLAKLS